MVKEVDKQLVWINGPNPKEIKKVGVTIEGINIVNPS